MKKTLSTLALLSVLSACSSAPLPNLPAQGLLPLQAQNVQLQGGADSLPVHLNIKQAEIEVRTAELNRQFEHILKLSEEKRLRNPVIQPLEGSSLEVAGRVKAAQLLPEVSFKVTGNLQAMPNNVIRFSPTDIRVVGIPVKSLLDILGLELSNIAKFKDRWGRVVQSGNDIDLVIEKFTTDAVIEGQIKTIRTSGSGISVIF